MYDNEIVGMNYRPIKIVSHEVDWVELQQKYHIRKSFDSVMKRLEIRGYVFSHGKSGRVYSLTKIGVDYVKGRFA